MAEVKRSRTRAAPVEAPAEARVSRRRPSGTGMDVTTPRAVDELSGFARGETVEIVLRVSAELVEGNLKQGDLENWVKDAVARHHNFRAGHVGFSKLATIRVPQCVRIDKPAD